MNGPAHRTLARALEVMGTKERLAEALDTPVAELEGYLLKGEVPDRVFFKALDIVARAPSAGKG